MSRRHSWATGVVVLLVVLSGCVGLAESGVQTPETDTPGSESAVSATQTSTAAPNGSVEVHFINVGQSASTLIVGPTNETMLVDTGDYTDDGEHVLRYLRRNNVTRIDHLVTTHADADHIGGHAAVIEYYETEADGIGAVYDPGIAASTRTYEEYLDAVEAYNVTLYETRAGDPVDFEGVDVEVLGPPNPYLEDRDRNENSIVLRQSYGNTSFLFTGDAEDDEERYLVDTYNATLRSAVLKAGHHGSDSSTSGALLDAVNPRVAVISSANDSQYGHPHEATLERLANHSIPAYWTATHGHTVLESNGSRITVSTQQAAPTDPLSLRAGTPIEPGTTDPVEQRTTIDVNDDSTEETSVATDGGTMTADGETETTDDEAGANGAGTLAVEEIHADAEGDEYENLDDEYVVFTNGGTESLDLTGWTVEDEAGHTYAFPDGFALDPGATVTLHTGSGTDSGTDLYWGSGSPIWNNGGDTVVVTDADGDEVLREEYS